MPHLLDITGLSVSFPTSSDRTRRVRALQGVSLHVDEGETLAVVGESGSGKSMTALSILGLVPEPGRIDGGRIEFAGRDLLTLSPREMRNIRGNQVAMIFQEPMSSLNPAITIGKQVAEPLRIHRGASKADALAQAEVLLSRVSIPDARNRLGAYPHEFSGGMRQRVMIAMALACEPKLIIADEPTTALDVTVQAQILELLRDLTRETNSALVLITHDLGVVARYADRVAVMYGGRIVEAAPAKQLYADPQHPYTVGLMASIPRLDGNPDEPLTPIIGQPPDLANLPVGCAFAPRCQYVHQRCRETPPPLEAVADHHYLACYGYQEQEGVETRND